MKKAELGKLKTPITIKSVTIGTDADGTQTTTEATVITGKCFWKNAFGNEAVENLRLNLVETATITMRYSSLVTVRQLVYRTGDSVAWEIASVDNIEQRNRWMELKLKRTVKA